MKTRPQRTLKREVTLSGVGLHTGRAVAIRFCPAGERSGIVFQRVDLPGRPKIPAAIEYVQDTARSTALGIGSNVVQTVEHVLAALFAYGIDNLCIQMTESEPPIGDGSSMPFVEMIESAGIVEQQATTTFVSLKQPIYYSQGGTHLVALPSDEYRISYTLHYPKTPVIRSQYFSSEVSDETFKKELAAARTFALYNEIRALMDRGLIRGGSLENAVVIKDNVIFSKEGLRYSDEMVRHKTLDLIGDLSLVGFPFLAHVIAICSGHTSNIALGKAIVNKLSSYVGEPS